MYRKYWPLVTSSNRQQAGFEVYIENIGPQSQAATGNRLIFKVYTENFRPSPVAATGNRQVFEVYIKNIGL
jgi:hypothetical protein